MQSFCWAPEHSAALQEYVVRGMSYAEAADAINARFGTAYTRGAAIGRGKRLGLVARPRPEAAPRFARRVPTPPKALPGTLREGASGKARPSPAVAEHPTPIKLRCVGIRPRLVSLVELGEGDCRYPYGGDKDGEAITFCGHPRRQGSPYCTPHFHLTRAPAVASERPAGPVVLRLVDAA